MSLTKYQAAAVARFDEEMHHATGHTLTGYEKTRAAGPTALAHVQLYGNIVDESGAVELLETWATEDRQSHAGRKPTLSFRAVLVLYLMHMDAGTNRYRNMARTLFGQLTTATREYLGITVTDGTEHDWYNRLWRAMNRLLALVSPWEAPRRAFLSADAYQRAVESYSQARRDRMDTLANALLHASVRRLPEADRRAYSGNIAIDATVIPLVGRPNPTNPTLARKNTDAMSGRYKREGDHKGNGKKTDIAAWELETVVTTPDSPKQQHSMPVLTTGITMHHPGRIKHGPLIAVDWHTKLFEQRKFILADRAYNNLRPERFQLPTREMGFRGVYDYPHNRLGKQAAIDDVILVDGCLYVKWMPKELVTVEHDLTHGLIDEETAVKRRRSRSEYRLMEKGRPGKDGSQRFSYPDLTRVLCIDPATRKRVRPQVPKTMTLTPDTDESKRIFRSLQSFEYATEDWHAWRGLRQHVESNNKYLKDDGRTDLGNRSKRRPRGYAYQLLSAAIAATIANLNRVVDFIRQRAERIVDTKTHRQHRAPNDTTTNPTAANDTPLRI